MDLERVAASHWGLRNPSQVAGMVRAILDGELLPPVLLLETPGGGAQILDGHHRCCAYWLSGRRQLGWGEFVLLPEGSAWRPARGSLPEFVGRLFGVADPGEPPPP